jgi:hypothetical protein
MAARILPQERVADCGRKLTGPLAAVVLGKNGAYINGTVTCGSIWMCPVCAGKIAEGRRREVLRCLDAHNATGGDVYMAAFTIPHTAFETCDSLRKAVANTWRKFAAGNGWKSAKIRYGVIGTIRALEVTHGKNGWHPHLHCLVMTKRLSPEVAEEFEFFVKERWISILERETEKQGSWAYAVDFRKAENNKIAGDYIVKWGVDSELTKAHLKFSKKGGRSPWQLLADAQNGDHQARVLFREYAVAFKGSRHLTWSKGLRDTYDVEPELTDEELAKMKEPHNGDTVLGTFDKYLFAKLYKGALIPDVINAAERNGWRQVLILLQCHGILDQSRDEN